MKDVYLNRPREINLKPNELIQLLKMRYRLLKSGHYFEERLKGILKRFSHETCISGAALFLKSFRQKIIGLCATHR